MKRPTKIAHPVSWLTTQYIQILPQTTDGRNQTSTPIFYQYGAPIRGIWVFHMIKITDLSGLHAQGSTQLWVGYGCAAQSFDHHPITKPEKTQICYLYQNHSFLEGPFLKPISAFYNVNWSTFWQHIDKPKDKFIGNYAFFKNATYL